MCFPCRLLGRALPKGPARLRCEHWWNLFHHVVPVPLEVLAHRPPPTPLSGCLPFGTSLQRSHEVPTSSPQNKDPPTPKIFFLEEEGVSTRPRASLIPQLFNSAISPLFIVITLGLLARCQAVKTAKHKKYGARAYITSVPNSRRHSWCGCGR